MSHLWSTLRVGSWTEKEQVATWLQRAYPKKVVIDTQRDGQMQSMTPQYTALQDALTSTGQWHELTIASFPPDNLAGRLGFQAEGLMNVLKVLHVAAGCVHSLYFTHLLDLVPTEAPLAELRLYPSFASTHFLQPHWSPVFQNLTVLVVNGRGIHEPFALLPAFNQLQIFEADRLPLPWYEPNANLPLLCTLQKLQLRASSVQWMAGREFSCLEECVILLPRTWVAVQQHGVKLPLCRKLTYHGYPVTVIQHFYAPQMKAIELGSHDCEGQRVYQQLQHLCRSNGSISKLTTLHLRLQCSEQVFFKVLKYFGPLKELVLSISHPSPDWQSFLESLTAMPSTADWPEWDRCDQWDGWHRWDQWCSSQTWRVNVLPHLERLSMEFPKGSSQSKCLENCPLFRLVAWTRAKLSSPLEHLEVRKDRGTTEDNTVDYISSSYLEKYLGTSSEICDSMIVRGMITQNLVIDYSDPPSFHHLHLTGLFRQLQALTIYKESDVEIRILPDLEQIKRVEIWHGIIPAYSLSIELPLVHTLQWLYLRHSTYSWMIGRTLKALEEVTLYHLKGISEDISGYRDLQADLPACRRMKWEGGYEPPSLFLSCPSVQFLQWEQFRHDSSFFGAAPKSLHDVLLNSSCLQDLKITISDHFGLDSLIQLIFCDSLEQGVWGNIKSAKMEVYCHPDETREQLFTQMVGHQRHYERLWKEFMVTKDSLYGVNLRASM